MAVKMKLSFQWWGPSAALLLTLAQRLCSKMGGWTE